MPDGPDETHPDHDYFLHKEPKMGTKNNDRCLSKVGDDEPIFVLRAQDKLAPIVVKLWLDMAIMQGLSEERQAEVRQIIEDMEGWQRVRSSKYPD